MTNPIIKRKKISFHPSVNIRNSYLLGKKKKITEIINYNHAFIRKREREKKWVNFSIAKRYKLNFNYIVNNVTLITGNDQLRGNNQFLRLYASQICVFPV